MSRLAEAYESGQQLSSHDVARDREIAQTLVAKLLTTLSQAELVAGSRGPGGGYSLARPPQEISLLDIVNVFERQDGNMVCPFGPNWCGSNEPCPLHEDYVAFTDRFNNWLSSTTLAVFTTSSKERPTRKRKAK
ncbi:Rrf2 family transcriptional regulator [Aeoliella sp. ICT_H6.2]|uniref:Rrf2 family transcriptional regulator n=2 Tax=Aeoliella straminimaris TaxID=2954799 RepID=A0A9X2JGG8_9BACT|nr:Rrf2 family transcriptional regulator [Aeoliella straminimaris]